DCTGIWLWLLYLPSLGQSASRLAHRPVRRRRHGCTAGQQAGCAPGGCSVAADFRPDAAGGQPQRGRTTAAALTGKQRSPKEKGRLSVTYNKRTWPTLFGLF